MANSPPPGWYPDPSNPSQLYWWDGGQWTNHTRGAASLAAQNSAPAEESAKKSDIAAASSSGDEPATSNFAASLKNLDSSQETYARTGIQDLPGDADTEQMIAEIKERTDKHPAGFYPDPSVPGQMRYWDGQTWTNQTQPSPSPAPAFQPQAPQPQMPVSQGAPQQGVSQPPPLNQTEARPSKGLDAVCWGAVWVVLLTSQFIYLPFSFDSGEMGGALASMFICLIYLAVIVALFLYAKSKGYRLGQQLAVSVAAIVTPMFLVALGLTLGWPQVSGDDVGQIGLIGLFLSLSAAALAYYGVRSLRAGLAAGILLSAALTALASIVAATGLYKSFPDWEFESSWPVIGLITAIVVFLALRLEANNRNMATWIWPIAFQGVLATMIIFGADVEWNAIGLLLAALLTATIGILALVLKRASLLAFAVVSSVLTWVWFTTLTSLPPLLSTVMGLPLSLVLLFGGFWLWRNQQVLRSHLPGFLANLHSGGPEKTLW